MKKELFRIVQVLIVISILLGTCSCANRESEHSDGSMDSCQKSNELTELFLADSTSLGDISVSTDAPKETVTRDNYIGEILENPRVIDLSNADYSIIDMGFGEPLRLGYDNDFTRDAIRNYLGDDTLNVCDISYFQNVPNINECFVDPVFNDISKLNVRASLNIARYFLEENGFCFITDEVPAAFFKENFQDLIDQFPLNGGYLFPPEDTSYYNFLQNIPFNSNFAYGEDMDTYRKCLYFALQEYNDVRRSLIYHLGVKQERCLATINGQELEINRLKYDAAQYNEITEKIEKAYGYKINILEPETIEGLKANGLNVDNYEKMYQELCGGTDFTYESYYSIKDSIAKQSS